MSGHSCRGILTDLTFNGISLHCAVIYRATHTCWNISEKEKQTIKTLFSYLEKPSFPKYTIVDQLISLQWIKLFPRESRGAEFESQREILKLLIQRCAGYIKFVNLVIYS